MREMQWHIGAIVRGGRKVHIGATVRSGRKVHTGATVRSGRKVHIGTIVRIGRKVHIGAIVRIGRKVLQGENNSKFISRPMAIAPLSSVTIYRKDSMKIYRYNDKNLTEISLTCFCEVIASGEYLLFVNKVTSRVKKKLGNKYVTDIIAEKLNNREKIHAVENLLAAWRSDYVSVVEELKDDGYFE